MAVMISTILRAENDWTDWLKTVAPNQSYIDYTAERTGIRVYKNQCRSIILQGELWSAYGVTYTMPVAERTVDLPITALAFNVRQFEESAWRNPIVQKELRELLTGVVRFEEVVSDATPK